MEMETCSVFVWAIVEPMARRVFFKSKPEEELIEEKKGFDGWKDLGSSINLTGETKHPFLFL